MRKKSFAYIVFILLLGALIGSALGEIIAFIIPGGVVKDFFLKSVSPGFGPATLNLILISVTLGFSVKINIVGVIGIFIAAYILKWID